MGLLVAKSNDNDQKSYDDISIATIHSFLSWNGKIYSFFSSSASSRCRRRRLSSKKQEFRISIIDFCFNHKFCLSDSSRRATNEAKYGQSTADRDEKKTARWNCLLSLGPKMKLSCRQAIMMIQSYWLKCTAHNIKFGKPSPTRLVFFGTFEWEWKFLLINIQSLSNNEGSWNRNWNNQIKHLQFSFFTLTLHNWNWRYCELCKTSTFKQLPNKLR